MLISHGRILSVVQIGLAVLELYFKIGNGNAFK